MLPCVCSVIDHRGCQNVVRTSVTHEAVPRVPLFCSYHILTSSVIYYWTDARQHGIYLLNLPLACRWSSVFAEMGTRLKILGIHLQTTWNNFKYQEKNWLNGLRSVWSLISRTANKIYARKTIIPQCQYCVTFDNFNWILAAHLPHEFGTWKCHTSWKLEEE